MTYQTILIQAHVAYQMMCRALALQQSCRLS